MMKSNLELKIPRIAFLLLLVLIIMSVVYALSHLQKLSVSDFWIQILVGFLCSFIGAAFYKFTEIILIKEPIQECKFEINKLRTHLDDFRDRELRGIRSIREKNDYKPEFWNGILEGADRKLYLAGHALYHWMQSHYKEFFISRLIEIARSGGKIKILMMNPTGSFHKRRLDTTGQSFEKKIKKTLHTLHEEIINKIPNRHRKNIKIKWITELDLYYMYIRTDESTLISPYLITADSTNAILFTFDKETQYASVFDEDFDKLFSLADKVKYPFD